jgi:hypothetical protein
MERAVFKVLFACIALLWLMPAQANNFCAGLASYTVQPLVGGKAFDLSYFRQLTRPNPVTS